MIKYRVMCGANTLKLAFELIRLAETNLLYNNYIDTPISVREPHKAMITHL